MMRQPVKKVFRPAVTLFCGIVYRAKFYLPAFGRLRKRVKTEMLNKL